MTSYTIATLGAWAKKSRKRLDAVVKQSSNDFLQLATDSAAGITRGGTLKVGSIPVDTGNLRASLVSSLSGSTAITQPQGEYNLVVGSMLAGDVARFNWTASYARRLHNGFVGEDSKGRYYNQAGWFWVAEHTDKWRGHRRSGHRTREGDDPMNVVPLYDAIIQRLFNAVTVPVALPNIAFNSKPPYYAVDFVSANEAPERAIKGAVNGAKLTGLFAIQIAAVVEANPIGPGQVAGIGLSNEMTQEIEQLFKSGARVYTYAGSYLTITSCFAQSGYKDGAYWRTPVVIRFTSKEV